MHHPPDAPAADRIAGAALAVATILTFAAILHHPSVTSATSRVDLLAQIVRFAPLDRTVHAVVIAAALGMVAALTAFAVRRGITRPAILAGLVAYAFGTAGAIGAALIDGFLIPAIAARFLGKPADRHATGIDIITSAAIAILIATRFWLFATSFSVAVWSIDLLRTRGWSRGVGIVGIVSVAAIVVVALSRTIDPHVLGIIVLLQGAWNIGIAMLLAYDRL